MNNFVSGQQEFEQGKTERYLYDLIAASNKLQYPEYYSLNDLAKQYGLAAIDYMRAYINQERDSYLKSDKCKMVTEYLADGKQPTNKE